MSGYRGQLWLWGLEVHFAWQRLTERRPKQIVTVGVGTERRPFDCATLQLTVRHVDDASVAAASEAAARSTADVLAALQELVPDAEDIETSRVDVSPRYDYSPRSGPRLDGFSVSNSLTVAVKDLDAVSAVIDAAVAAAGNALDSLYGPDFAVDPATAARADRVAWKKAVRECESKAELLAETAGCGLAALAYLSDVPPGAALPGPMLPGGRHSMASMPLMDAPAEDSIGTPVVAGRGAEISQRVWC